MKFAHGAGGAGQAEEWPVTGPGSCLTEQACKTLGKCVVSAAAAGFQPGPLPLWPGHSYKLPGPIPDSVGDTQAGSGDHEPSEASEGQDCSLALP